MSHFVVSSASVHNCVSSMVPPLDQFDPYSKQLRCRENVSFLKQHHPKAFGAAIQELFSMRPAKALGIIMAT